MAWSNRYSPKEVEQRLYKKWEKENYFSPLAGNSKNEKGFFSVILPPPNVTGSLHLGHALNHTIQDCLIRWKKMDGYKAVWLPGTDHAGIATQIQVERTLFKNKQTKEELGRENFLKKVWDWKNKYGNQIIEQMKRLGDACDWSQSLFTLDPSSAAAVKKAFVYLYKKGWIYRGTRLVNWSVGLSSAISDLEVEYRQTQSKLWKIRYPLKGEKKFLVIATTRPETLIADQAVAVHPEDSRYKKYHGGRVILPLIQRELPIITDRYVDPKFGTGVLKITPAHDFNDYKIGKTHNLEEMNILNPDGTMNEKTGSYQGLSVLSARKKIISDLKEKGFLDSEEPYSHQVAFCSRSGSVVEPFLSKQWFMKMKEPAEKGLSAVTNGEVELIPKTWEKTFNLWMNNIEDWCLSRQLWWGHRVPAWWCGQCREVTVCEEDTLKTCGHCGSCDLNQEEDVLDTWFSSALWPMSVLKWPLKENLQDHDFYPSSVLVTAPDILFFWVARMIMMGLEFQGKIPFRQVYLHGVVRDEKGIKMSKSLGNGEDPIDLIEQSGADSLRLSLLSSHARGRDVRFSRKHLEVCRNFLNKIWNAGRFVDQMPSARPKNFSAIDEWILNRLKKTERKVNQELKDFRFSSACVHAYNFSWKEFCDWHLEWIKPIIQGDDEDLKQSVYWTAGYVFHRIIKLLHPFIPFITEEIYQRQKTFKSKKSILLDSYPDGTEKFSFSKKKEQEISFVQELVTAIRRLRGGNNIKPSTKMTAYLFVPSNFEGARSFVKEHLPSILFLARLKNLEFGELKQPARFAKADIAEGVKIYLPLEEGVDRQAQKNKMDKQIIRLEKEKQHIEKQLNLKDFLSKAPKNIVREKQLRKKEIEKHLQNLSRSLQNFN